MDDALVFEALRRGLITPEMAKQKLSAQSSQPQVSTGEDVTRGASSGIIRGIPTAIDVPAAALATGVEKLTGSKGTLGQLFQQNLQNGLNAGANKVLGPEYQPQTELGTLAKGAGLAVGTLPLGGSGAVAEGLPIAVGRAAASGAGSTLGSQIGGKLGGTPGAIIGGIIGGTAGAYTPEIMRKAPNPAAPLQRAASEFKEGYQTGEAPPLKNAEDFHQLASQAFQRAEQAGGTLTPKITNSFIDDAVKTLVPQTTEGKIVAGTSEASKLAERIQQIKDRPLSLQAAQEIDEHLGDIMDELVDPKTGQLNKQGYKISQLQQTLRNTIKDAPETEVMGGKEGFNALSEAATYGQQE